MTRPWYNTFGKQTRKTFPRLPGPACEARLYYQAQYEITLRRILVVSIFVVAWHDCSFVSKNLIFHLPRFDFISRPLRNVL